jgi:hypothetical protein
MWPTGIWDHRHEMNRPLIGQVHRLNHFFWVGFMVSAGNTEGGSMTVPLTPCLTGLESAVWQLTIFVFICKTE